MRQTLTGLGIDLQGAQIYDGSGLSRHDRLDAETLVDVLQLASAADHPELRSVVTGLPVAAYDGSLAYRFDRSPGRGWVRAKTGTLTGTSALAGLVTDARGGCWSSRSSATTSRSPAPSTPAPPSTTWPPASRPAPADRLAGRPPDATHVGSWP